MERPALSGAHGRSCPNLGICDSTMGALTMRHVQISIGSGKVLGFLRTLQLLLQLRFEQVRTLSLNLRFG